MTPKDTALRLCQDFAMTTFGEEFNGGTTLPLKIAKKISIIAVDGIIKELGKVGGDQLTEDDDGYECSINFRTEFWLTVKSEISSL